MPAISRYFGRPMGDLVLYGILIVGIALAFQGSRGLQEPDEGRYAQAGVEMLRTGDWRIPRLQGLVYLDKPPMVYWSVAAGVKALGVNEWGVRLGNALALAAASFLVCLWSGRAWGKRIGRLAGVAYATTLAPALAANALTPDTLLVVFTTATSFSYWSYRRAGSIGQKWRWALALGCCVGLGLLTKSTAALVFLAPVVIYAFWQDGFARTLGRLELWVAALLGAAIGLSWFLEVSRELPGAASYFFDNHIAGRLWEDSYQRNPQWWAPFNVYGSVLMIGSLPWSLVWLRAVSSRARRVELRGVWNDPLVRYLTLATVFPLAVFCVARSRLPLYILPVFPMLIMLTIFASCRYGTRCPWSTRVTLAVLVVVSLKLAASLVPSDTDSRGLAEALGVAGVTTDDCIDGLETKIHGLSVYGYRHVTWHTIWPEAYPYFEAPRTVASALPKLLEACNREVRFVVRSHHLHAAQEVLARGQLDCSDSALSANTVLVHCVAGSASG